MQKIVFLGSLSGGGKERRMGELIRHLYKIGGYELHLLSIDDGKSNTIDYPYVIECLTSHHYINRQCSRWKTYKSLWKLLDEIHPDIVHDWCGDRTGFYLLPQLYKHKFYYIAGFIADGNKDSYLHSLIYKLVYFFSDKIISNSWAGIISHKAPPKKSQVIYNGFNSDRLPLHNRSEELRTELKLGNQKIISMAARITPEKDYYMFLRVAQRIQKIRNDVTFLIIGRGNMEAQLKEYIQINQIKNVQILGFRKDVIDLLKLSYISLLCSNSDLHAEGISNSIMESMACGTPVIATNGGGTSEIIENKINGFIVPPHDDEKMTKIALQLIEDENLRNKISHSCMQTITNKFSISKMVEQYTQIYNRKK